MDRPSSINHLWIFSALLQSISWSASGGFCFLSVTILEIRTTASPVKILRLLLVTYIYREAHFYCICHWRVLWIVFHGNLTLILSWSFSFFLTDTVAAHRNGRLLKLLKKSTTSKKEQSQESELWTGRGAADKVPAHKEEPFFSYSRMWPPVLGAAIMMSMFLAWVAAKPLVVHRIRTRMSARPGRPPFKRQMSTPNVDKFQRVWVNWQFWALLPSTVELKWQLETCEQGGSGKHRM